MNQVPMKTIRSCTESDLGVLRRIAHETYDETFRSMNSAETMDKYLKEAFNSEKLLTEINNPNSEFYFLQVDGAVVGYLKLNNANAQTDINDPNGLEIERVYVRQQFQGNGYGKDLIEFVLERARSLRKKYAWLGVWEKNAAAIAFYKKLGFKESGMHTFRMGDELQSDHIMRKELRALSNDPS